MSHICRGSPFTDNILTAKRVIHRVTRCRIDIAGYFSNVTLTGLGIKLQICLLSLIGIVSVGRCWIDQRMK